MDFFEVVARRRSIRRFRPDPVPPEALTRMLEAARLAPSGVNCQPWRFAVITEPHLRERIAAAAYGQRQIATAPVIIVACADLRVYRQQRARLQELVDAGALEPSFAATYAADRLAREEDLRQYASSAMFNVAIAVEHLVLAAAAQGLGTCWTRYFDARAVAALLDLPPEVLVVALIPVGYPAEDPPPRPRLPLEEILLRVPEGQGGESGG